MSKQESSSGLGFTSVLTLIFIVLKLTDVINWSWFWVLSPSLIPLIIWLIIIGVVFIANWMENL